MDSTAKEVTTAEKRPAYDNSVLWQDEAVKDARIRAMCQYLLYSPLSSIHHFLGPPWQSGTTTVALDFEGILQVFPILHRAKEHVYIVCYKQEYLALTGFAACSARRKDIANDQVGFASQNGQSNQ